MHIQHSNMGFYFDYPTANTFELDDWVTTIKAMNQLEQGAIANPTENRQVGHYWLRNPDLAPIEMAQVIRQSYASLGELEREIQQRNFETLLMVGIGGSALGPQLLVEALPCTTDYRRVLFLDNTDPDGFDCVLRTITPKQTLVAVVSKSGGTKETRNAMMEVQALYARHEVPFSEHAVALTVEGSQLDQLAIQDGWLFRLPLWNWVGGRTSVTGVVGLLPLMFLQRNWVHFLEGAQRMDDWTRTLSPDNPALQMAHLWYTEGNGHGDRNMVVLPYKDALGLFGKYLQQLIMESIGKRLDRNGQKVCQGLTVYGNKGSTDQHAFVQQLRDGRHDFFTVLIGVLEDRRTSVPKVWVEENVGAGDYLLGFLMGTRHALQDAGRTVSTLVVERLTEATLGALVALFERTVGFYAERLNINAYDQPGVEAGKRAAAEMLDLRARLFEGADVSDADPLDIWIWTEHQRINAER